MCDGMKYIWFRWKGMSWSQTTWLQGTWWCFIGGPVKLSISLVVQCHRKLQRQVFVQNLIFYIPIAIKASNLLCQYCWSVYSLCCAGLHFRMHLILGSLSFVYTASKLQDLQDTSRFYNCFLWKRFSASCLPPLLALGRFTVVRIVLMWVKLF